MRERFFILSLVVGVLCAKSVSGSVKGVVSGALGAIQGLNQQTPPSETISFGGTPEPSLHVEEDKMKMSSDQIIRREGYPLEIHHIITTDSYNLTVFRIPRPGGVPAYLLHGVMCSSREFLVQPGKQSLPFQLYDAGFDVWIGNNRGTNYSLGHLQYSTDDPRYWQFSLDHIAKYDIPNAIDYVLKYSRQPKLVFIGYSLGTQTFFYSMALEPSYNQKIIQFVGLAPFIYLGNLTSPLRVLSLVGNDLTTNKINEALTSGAFFPEKLLPFLGRLMPEACNRGNILKDVTNGVCADFTSFLMGPDNNETNRAILPVAFKEFPNQVSVFMVRQLLEEIRNPNSRHYNYGSEEANKQKYGTPQPPAYRLGNVVAPCILYGGKSDAVVHPKDVDWLANNLPCYPRRRYVESFNHLDFVYGKHTPILSQHVVRDLLDIIHTGSFQGMCQNRGGGENTGGGQQVNGILSDIVGGIQNIASNVHNSEGGFFRNE